jgi:hypothetical protein
LPGDQLDDDRDTTLTEDIVNALNELADSNDLMGSEHYRYEAFAI